ncbi:MAG TPA: DASS family sodium-coupled anion symporter [Cyclobacteriaceae bacterium]|jgi:sodium-dependent dicarboxylate transporter 2/3/5|nr:DASS family sodium-coupled anion symporter [Cytophagales bacterium]HNT49409.1 DASS family sodium-coupled anion symporter [Cyclobacteriaceae bacterium]HRE67864.1 DASS family sodium-coupled anion symporter [Cyclobacteriaceae bacterium]HRF33854.1 DASS family sodium-coupled anion symporter [Cyclobacteriaceae bacterium]
MDESSNHPIVKQAGFIAGPLAFILITTLVGPDFISPSAGKVLAVATWMIIWWISEAAPVSITALLPLIIFPFLGIMKMSEAAAPYANPIIFLFMGGFMIALALEKHRLHERIALNLVRVTGTSGNGIILGFTIATGFISMWISNTATAMMMLPIAISVINLLRRTNSETITLGERNFGIVLMLVIAYAANIGGVATIIGTPPNVVFIGLLDQFSHTKISFGKWMLVGLPLSIAVMGLGYVALTRFLFPNKLQQISGADALIKNRLTDLGPMRTEEKLVLAIFTLTSLSWIFQQPFNLLLGSELLNDTNIGMAGGALMFLVPASFRQFKFLLVWKDTEKLSWGILILFGGGLCLAQGLSSAGIIQAVGSYIAQQSQSVNWLLFGLITASIFITELMSNVALIQIFIPVVFGIAANLGIDPILLGMPVTLGASMAFMFPIATPPNAIVFSSGHMNVKDMMRAGLVINIIALVLIYLGAKILVPLIL